MKKAFLFALCIMSQSAFSGCLDNLTSATSITSKIKGFYVNSPGWRPNHYIILDRDNCSAGSGVEQLGSGTKTDYYLLFEDGDKFLQSSLLMAYAKGEIVRFRIGAQVNNYNKINYIVIPHDAR